MRAVVKHRNLLDNAVIYKADQDLIIFHRQEGSLVDRVPTANGRNEIKLPETVAVEARSQLGPAVYRAAAERDWRRIPDCTDPMNAFTCWSPEVPNPVSHFRHVGLSCKIRSHTMFLTSDIFGVNSLIHKERP